MFKLRDCSLALKTTKIVAAQAFSQLLQNNCAASASSSKILVAQVLTSGDKLHLLIPLQVVTSTF